MLSEWSFVPNYLYDKIKSLLASEGEQRVDIIKDRSAYGGDKSWVSRNDSTEYIYPVVYTVNCKNIPTMFWSSVNDRGHFGVPKVIYGGGGSTGFISDLNGEYGLTEWCSGIVTDETDSHSDMIDILSGESFRDIVKAISISKSEIETKILRLFKHKFWTML